MKTYTAESITDTLMNGGDVNIPGVGKLIVKMRPARLGRNPATGEQITVPAKRVVKFKQSTTIGSKLNGG